MNSVSLIFLLFSFTLISALPSTNTENSQMFVTTSSHQSQIIEGTLSDVKFLTNSQHLALSDKLRILNAVTKILLSFNPNLQLQSFHLRYKVSRRLQTIRSNLSKFRTAYAFHLQMCRLFMALNDGHSTYSPPQPLRSAFASLGFYVDRYYDDKNQSKYVMSSLWKSVPFYHPTFVPGVEVLAVDGQKIHDAVLNFGDRSYARREEDKVRFGQYYLTFREFRIVGVPKKDYAVFKYRTLDGTKKFVRIPFRYIFQLPSSSENTTDTEMTIDSTGKTLTRSKVHEYYNQKKFPVVSHSLISKENEDEEYLQKSLKQSFISQDDVFGQTKKLLYNPSRKYMVSHLAQKDIMNSVIRNAPKTLQRTPIKVKTYYSDKLYAEKISLQDGTVFGRLAVYSFLPENHSSWEKEVRRLLELLPKQRLVMDIRANFGGNRLTTLKLWELVTNDNITAPAYPLVSRITPLCNEFMVRSDLFNYLENFETHLKMGYSLSGPADGLTFNKGRRFVDRLRQIYFGKVITLVSSFTASAGDFYTSLVRDVAQDFVLGTDSATNGAGAIAMKYSEMVKLAPDLLKELPQNVDFFSALFRFYRGGKADGALVEQFGVPATKVYKESREDIMNGGSDMYEYIGKLFRSFEERSS